jgi:hypothetical protein
MMKRQLVACLVGLVAATSYIGVAVGAENYQWREEYSIERSASEVWEDWFGYKQACGFEHRVDYNDKFVVHFFKDREVWKYLFRDTYTNLLTGFSFVDFASYTIVFDYETGLADHRGVFWRIQVPGEGMVILDVGGFLQDWYADDWQATLPGSLIGNNHDVNIGMLPPVSYCDLMAEIFPE